ncbi:MAG: transglutaminase domain-containing protein [Phycisphaerales bacterium]
MRWVAIVLIGLAGGSVGVGAQGAPPAPRPGAPAAAKFDMGTAVRDRVASILNAAGDDGSFSTLARDLQTLVDQVIAYAPDNTAALTEAVAALRLVQQLSQAEEGSRKPLLGFLRKHGELQRTLVFLVRNGDSTKNVYGVLDRLRAACGDRVGQFPALAAAICVVHDQPIRAQASIRAAMIEKKPSRTIDPVEVFRYYASREERLVFPVRQTPAELLVYVVDSPAEPGELEWAFSRYAGDRNPGNRYDEITYDTAHYKLRKPKKISALDYTLENIRKVGGVCGEQAYFAANVGKAIGVPAAVISGRGPSMSHAWVGVLHGQASGPRWALEEGCFGDYKKLRGNLTDPQTRRPLAAPELHLLAESVSSPAAQRHAAVALADGAQRLAALGKRSRAPWPPPPLPGMEGAAPVTAKADAAAAMGFLERAVKAAPTSTAVWAGLAPVAGEMTGAERERWSGALYRACSQSPDFCQRMLGLMIEGLEDPRERARAWAWAAARAQQRADLRTVAILARGAALEEAGDKGAAYGCYEEVWQKLINDASEAVESLERAEKLLRASGKEHAAVAAYADAFRRVMRPSTTVAFDQSNYYRVGERYAELLEKAGRAGEARSIRNRIKAGPED